MPVYEDTHLPTEEELTVQEINLTTSFLQAAAHHVGKTCDEYNKEFMLCREEEKDPRKCIDEGKLVTACALDFFKKVKALCRHEFEQYANCINYSSQEFKFEPCRKTQAVFDRCMVDKMGLERPPLGYFSLVRVHNTNRPKPIHEKPVFPDVPAELPDDYPKEPAKYGSRFFSFF